METGIWTLKERRRHPRYAVDVGVELRLQDDLGKHLIGYYGCAKDVSLGGLRIEIPKHKDVEYSRIKEKVKFQARILTPNIQKYLELNGQVIWHLQKEENYNIGMQFTNNDKEREEALCEFLKSIK
ncbi:PilZ domain-containing protein [bacterium]|nr:PilZ domain-containing protein [bacterium]